MLNNSFEANLTNWFLRKTSTGSVRRVADLPISIASNVGLVREENQDRVAVMRFAGSFGKQEVVVALCDGMGGMAEGANCAAQALASFFASLMNQAGHSLDSHSRLYEAAQFANRNVFRRFRGRGGATLSAVLLDSNARVFSINIGDSRIYSFASEKLKQLTIDDTLAGQLSKDPNEYLGGSELIQFIGAGPLVEPHISERFLAELGSTLLLTSDGIHFLPLSMLQSLLSNAKDAALAARRLSDLALWCGGHDNASLAAINLKGELFDQLTAGPSGAIEVWDPYGEVRFFSFDANRASDSKPQKSSDQPLKLEGEASKYPPSINDPVDRNAKPKSADEPKSRIAKPRKGSKKKTELDDANKKDVDDDTPQLMMNFRKRDEAQ